MLPIITYAVIVISANLDKPDRVLKSGLSFAEATEYRKSCTLLNTAIRAE